MATKSSSPNPFSKNDNQADSPLLPLAQDQHLKITAVQSLKMMEDLLFFSNIMSSRSNSKQWQISFHFDLPCFLFYWLSFISWFDQFQMT
ncbi:unnamed protein product, partial [Musa hybrid cultivar]